MSKRLFEFIIRFVAAACGLLLVFAISNSELFRSFEKKTYDYRFRIKTSMNRTPADDSIVIVGIDDKTLDSMPKAISLWDKEFSDTLSAIDKGRAAAIGMDVLDIAVPENAEEDTLESPLISGAGAASKTVFPYIADGMNLRIPYFVIEAMRSNLPKTAGVKYPPDAKLMLLSVAVDIKCAGGFGYSSAFPDNDGVIRGTVLTQIPEWGSGNPAPAAAAPNEFGKVPDKLYNFSLLVYLRYAGMRESEIVPANNTFKIRGASIPLNDNGSMNINFTGPPGTFKKISMIDVLDNKNNVEFLKKYFSGKIVLLGAYSNILGDVHVTPYFHTGGQKATLMYGVEVIANTIHTFKSRQFIRFPSPALKWAILIVAAALSVFILGRFRLVAGAGFLIALILCYLGVSYFVFDRFNYVLEVTGFLVLVPLCFSLSFLCDNTIIGREKRFIHEVFTRYLDPRIVDELARRGDTSILNGQRKDVSVLFSDIRGFTTLSENLPPEIVVKILNKHLTRMTELVTESGGMAVSYMGDAIMAMWNAPWEIPDHRLAACRCALKMSAAMAEVNKYIRDEEIPLNTDLKIGIGINSGPASVGNIGSEIKSDFTVIGDTTNVASRLESMNKQYQTGIIISEAVCRDFMEKLVVRDLDLIIVKGRREPLRVYELLGIAD